MSLFDSQPELDLKADYGWFHIMRPRLLKGLIADIGETAWAVYTVLKAHVDHNSGLTFPTQQRIGDMIGKTPETVSAAIKKLIKADLIKEEGKRGRQNVYSIKETAPLAVRHTDEPIGSMDFKYVPAEFGRQLSEIKRFLAEGVPTDSSITLNLTVNLIQQKDNGVVNLQNIQLGPAAGSEVGDETLARIKRLNNPLLRGL